MAHVQPARHSTFLCLRSVSIPRRRAAKVTGLCRSTDSGETWRLVYPSPATVRGVRMDSDHADETIVADPDPLGNITALAIDPMDSRTLYAAATQNRQPALFTSRDFGKTWSREASLPETARHIWIDPRSPQQSRTLYIACVKSLQHEKEAANFSTSPRLLRLPPFRWALLLAAALCQFSGRGICFARWGQELAEVLAAGNRRLSTCRCGQRPSPSNGVSRRQSFGPQRPGLDGRRQTSDAGRTWRLVGKEDEQPAANVRDAGVTERFGTGWGENPVMLGVAEQDPNLCYGTDFGRTM